VNPASFMHARKSNHSPYHPSNMKSIDPAHQTSMILQSNDAINFHNRLTNKRKAVEGKDTKHSFIVINKQSN
jgi:hypothetical protein